MKKQRITAALVVKNNKILSVGTNEHKEPCKRIGYPTGEGYELCDGCNYDNHAEANAVRGLKAKGAKLILFGHTYACEPCKEAVKKAGIKEIIICEL